MKTRRTVTTSYLLPRVATLAVLMAVMGCDSDRDAGEITAPAPESSVAEDAERDARPNYTDRVTTTELEPDYQEQSSDQTADEEANDAESSMVKTAIAQVRPTKLGDVEGTVTFSAAEDGREMHVAVELAGLEPGLHGFHVHEVGDCSADDASSAGGHFNPNDTLHGSPDAAEHHAGDMGNIVADDNGRVFAELTFRGLSFSGPASILQKAVVVHSDKDDLESQPAGNAGSRIGCGVILRMDNNTRAQ